MTTNGFILSGFVEETNNTKFRGHDADGGQVLELSHRNVEMIVEMIVESPGHVVHDLRDF